MKKISTRIPDRHHCHTTECTVWVYRRRRRRSSSSDKYKKKTLSHRGISSTGGSDSQKWTPTDSLFSTNESSSVLILCASVQCLWTCARNNCCCCTGPRRCTRTNAIFPISTWLFSHFGSFVMQPNEAVYTETRPTPVVQSCHIRANYLITVFLLLFYILFASLLCCAGVLPPMRSHIIIIRVELMSSLRALQQLSLANNLPYLILFSNKNFYCIHFFFILLAVLFVLHSCRSSSIRCV